MMSIISKAFGMDSGPASPLGHQRLVDLSGNLFIFAMPEDFSRDMPAEDLTERVSLNDPGISIKSEAGNVVRRWWDVKSRGFRSKPLGSLMMNVAVRKVPRNFRRDIVDRELKITDRLDFILAVAQTMDGRYRQADVAETSELAYGLPAIAYLAGNNIEAGYGDEVFNNQKWTRYGITGPYDQSIVGYAIPLTLSEFLEVEFTYSPNNRGLPRDFRQMASEKVAQITETFRIDYSNENPMRRTVEGDWLNATTDELFSEKSGEVIGPLFGNEVLKRLEASEGEIPTGKAKM